MSTAQYGTISEVQDLLEDIRVMRDALIFCADMLGIIVSAAVFYLLLKSGVMKRVFDV